VKFPITSVNAGQHRVVLSAEVAESLRHLVVTVRALVKQRVNAEEKRLLAIIQSLPIETIHSGDLHTPRIITATDVHKRRKRGARSNRSLQGRRAKTHAP
jgi:hypothetical protein